MLSRRELAPENLYLRKQFALFQERKVSHAGRTLGRVPPNPHRHSLPVGYRMVNVLGGLHHEYGLAKEAG
jgi:hypothetical protein